MRLVPVTAAHREQICRLWPSLCIPNVGPDRSGVQTTITSQACIVLKINYQPPDDTFSRECFPGLVEYLVYCGSALTTRKNVGPTSKCSLGSNVVSVTVFEDISNQRIVTLTYNLSRSSEVKPMSSLYNLRWVQHRNCCPSWHISCQKVWPWFLTPRGHPRSNLTVPIESSWVLHISAPWGPASYLSPFSRYFE